METESGKGQTSEKEKERKHDQNELPKNHTKVDILVANILNELHIFGDTIVHD